MPNPADLLALREALADALAYTNAAISGEAFNPVATELNLARDALKTVKFKGVADVVAEGPDALTA
jgi:hypothetical protein